MRSFRNNLSDRRKSFLSFAGQIESQLREAYEHRHIESGENQATLGAKLGVGRSAINKRLTGRINMTMETIADMAWALGYQISVRIFDPRTEGKNSFLQYPLPAPESSTSISGAAVIDKKEVAQDDPIVIISTSQSKTIPWGNQLQDQAA